MTVEMLEMKLRYRSRVAVLAFIFLLTFDLVLAGFLFWFVTEARNKPVANSTALAGKIREQMQEQHEESMNLLRDVARQDSLILVEVRK